MQFGSYIPPPYPFPDRWWMVANSPQATQWLQPTIPFQQNYAYSYYQNQQQFTQEPQEAKNTTEDTKEVEPTTEISNEVSEFVPRDEVSSVCYC